LGVSVVQEMFSLSLSPEVGSLVGLVVEGLLSFWKHFSRGPSVGVHVGSGGWRVGWGVLSWGGRGLVVWNSLGGVLSELEWRYQVRVLMALLCCCLRLGPSSLWMSEVERRVGVLVFEGERRCGRVVRPTSRESVGR
jgi:hypothetical protein